MYVEWILHTTQDSRFFLYSLQSHSLTVSQYSGNCKVGYSTVRYSTYSIQVNHASYNDSESLKIQIKEMMAEIILTIYHSRFN